jgi:hypothetical protein
VNLLAQDESAVASSCESGNEISGSVNERLLQRIEASSEELCFKAIKSSGFIFYRITPKCA